MAEPIILIGIVGGIHVHNLMRELCAAIKDEIVFEEIAGIGCLLD